MQEMSKKRFNFDAIGESELYLTYFAEEEDLDERCLRVPLSTLITIFVVNIAEKLDNEPLPKVKIFLKPETSLENCGRYVSINRNFLKNILVLDSSNFQSHILIDSCVLPAILIPDYQLCVTGLCSVLRRLLKTGNGPSLKQDRKRSELLLGYQGNCLSAPAEVSSWTRFCEIDLPETASKVLAENFESPEVELPIDVARFEEHMKQPIRMHNIRKRMGKLTASNGNASSSNGNLTSASDLVMSPTEKDTSEPVTSLNGNEMSSNLDVVMSGTCKVLKNGRQVIADQHGREVDPIEIFARTQHIFAEGPDCLLSDLVVFPLMFLVTEKFCAVQGRDNFEKVAPLTSQWMKNVVELFDAEHIIRSLIYLAPEFSLCHPPSVSSHLSFPQVPAQSLYKSDPKRNNPASRIFTRQNDVDRVLTQIGNLDLQLFNSTEAPSCPGVCVDSIDWSTLPRDVHPMGGELPPDRVAKKCHQLENMTSAVLRLARTGDTIVDFCSGGGHLGIVIAFMMPSATVILVENKEESLMRAVARVNRLGLTNCRFFQGNMDYFTGTFDVGVSLHACGVATDLVIKACIANQASFVSCPCCYGSVQENHVLEYPRSQHFRSRSIEFKDYLILGHTADQTHVTNDKHDQGQYCMDFVDSDRVHLAKESGYYDVVLTKMKPESCSPKNNLIVATFSK